MPPHTPTPATTPSPAVRNERFPQAQCDALFAAVLAHDDIDLDAGLPDTIHLDYTPEQLDQCFRICKQLW